MKITHQASETTCHMIFPQVNGALWLQFLKTLCWLLVRLGGTSLRLKRCPKLCCLENGLDTTYSMLHAGLLDLRACTCHGVRKQVYAHALAEFAMEVAQAHQAPLVGTWDSRGDMAATGSMTAPPGNKNCTCHRSTDTAGRTAAHTTGSMVNTYVPSQWPRCSPCLAGAAASAAVEWLEMLQRVNNIGRCAEI